MIKTLKLSAALAICTSAAFAGGFQEPASEVPPATPAVDEDWSGFYAGLGYASLDGEAVYEGEFGYEFKDAQNPMVFLGYRLDRGKMVYGGELAATIGDVWEDGYEDDYGLTSLYDLKATIGYDMGKFLPYVSLGYSFGDYMLDATDGFDASGYLIGLGFDYAITDQFTAGLSYDYREMDIKDQDIDVTLKSLALKMAYTF